MHHFFRLLARLLTRFLETIEPLANGLVSFPRGFELRPMCTRHKLQNVQFHPIVVSET
jgi:hypothetical protein